MFIALGTCDANLPRPSQFERWSGTPTGRKGTDMYDESTVEVSVARVWQLQLLCRAKKRHAQFDGTYLIYHSDNCTQLYRNLL